VSVWAYHIEGNAGNDETTDLAELQRHANVAPVYVARLCLHMFTHVTFQKRPMFTHVNIGLSKEAYTEKETYY